MTENGVSKVRFDLWAVLGFLVLMGVMSSGYIFNAQSEDRKEQRKTQDQVIVLQEQYKNINEKLDKLVRATESINNAFVDHRVKTEEVNRKMLKGKE